ncbi:MAG TPA: ATP-binding protein, partial [Pyrinomonadaceae bacterium]|nr:ATP-binding protein [Pyrinomonadaceae bacterium]
LPVTRLTKPESLSQPQLARSKSMSITFALLAFCIGGAALLGWIFDIEILKRIHPTLVNMKANTAVCLMLSAASLLLLQNRPVSNTRRLIVQLFAAIVGSVGLITLSEHVFGWNTGLDLLLFFESADEAGQSFPGRMGVAASMDFLLLGIALSFIDARSNRWFRVSSIAVLMVVGVTLLVFLYYFYGIERLEPIGQYFTIALHTVVAFLSLCAAILLARPERGIVAALMENSPGAVVARRMWPALLIVILLGWLRTIARDSGLLSPGFSTATFVLAILLLLVFLIWWTAVSLNRTDRDRRLADLALRDSQARLTVLVQVSDLIRTLHDPYDLSYAVAKTVGAHMKVRRCLFNEIDLDHDLEIVHRDYCDGGESVAGEHRISDYSNPTSEGMKAGQIIINYDSKTDPRTAADYQRSYEATGERAYIAVPLMREGRWVASLWASDDQPREWTNEEVSLLKMVAERTWTAVEKLRAEVERERLLQSEQEARDAAEKANKLKDEFLATLSHELRNPLNVILGYSELLLRMPEIEQSPRLAQMGEALKRNAQSQSQLINDLLDLSRLQRGKIALHHETVSLPAIIDSAVETVRADAAAKDIDVRVNVSDQLLLVDGDRLRLQQIAWNLLNNAVKFTPPGGTIEIRLSGEGESAVLTVADTGQGIDPAFLPHVFEMFRQADSSRIRRHGGMGIGLALVQQLAQLHNGTVSAESEGTGKGSRFTVRLPLTREAQKPSPSLGSSPVELGVLAETDLLVVDDSEDTIAMLEQLLKTGGASVTTATNGADALRLAREREFDLILSDISMPEMDGFEFLRRLRKIEGRQDVPVVAITGFGRNADIERARAAGFYSHLTKPLNLQALAEVLQRLRAQSSSNGQDRAVG